MRRAPLLASSLALTLLAAPASAVVTEPNGQQVPVNQQNGEVRLDAFFAQIGEPIDWQADALATPTSFSPLCGFTAQFVLNQAGSHFGLAWYNETGAPPQPSELHILLPAGSPVGATFSGTAIKSDPAYLGGQVGFALVGGETHYTNPAYDNVYGGNGQPWITALMYASKNTPNAYYVCFEDGGTSASGWNNDGDFNDDVFFVTGITCSGGGQPCDTGKPGICASGATQCAGAGTVCQQLVQPSGEKCNGLDDDCNGQVDDGDLCQAGFVCDKGTCVQSCQSGEFTCPADKVCNASGFCVEPACKDVTCEAGKVCHGGTCSGPCDAPVACPYPTVCRVGVCVDACAGVTCDSGQVCEGGVCVTRCDCLPCAGGKACDAASGHCLEPACVGVSCGPGTHCAGGSCADDCAGAVCPTGQECKTGQCVDKPAGTGGGGTGGGTIGFGGGGSGTGTGGSNAGGAGTGATGTGTTGTTATGGVGGSEGSKSSCGCEVVGDEAGGLGWLGVAGIAALGLRRRRAALSRT